MMEAKKSRKYFSPTREQRALATKNRIIDVAEKLLIEKGFAAMTVADVAKRAGTSPQTVYAVFSSKAGIIMAAIEDRVFKDERNADAIKLLQTTGEPGLMLCSIAKIMRNIYENHTDTFAAVYGARMVSRELVSLEKELGEYRREKQAPFATCLYASGKLLPELSEEDVKDILWTLTSREIYYLLVIRSGWPASKYENHLRSLLFAALLGRWEEG